MAHSLEVRVPLVDYVLWSELAALLGPSGRLRSKKILALAPTPPLPAALYRRPKTGFVVPVWSWLSGSRPLDAWRRLPLLRDGGAQGSRRWGYTVFQIFAGHLPVPAP